MFKAVVESWEIDFESPLSWREIQERWNAAGPWKWDAFENDERGSYLRAQLSAANGKIKVMDGPPRWTIEVVIEVRPGRIEKVRAEIDDAIHARLLPALGAGASAGK